MEAISKFTKRKLKAQSVLEKDLKNKNKGGTLNFLQNPRAEPRLKDIQDPTSLDLV